MSDPSSRVRTRDGHDSFQRPRRMRPRRGGVTALVRDTSQANNNDELDFAADEDVLQNQETTTIRVDILSSNVPGRARRRSRQRRGVVAAATTPHAAAPNQDDLDFDDDDGLPEQRPAIRPRLPPSNAPQHVRDLFTLKRRAQMTTLSRENGIVREVAGAESNHVNIKTDLAIRRVNACVTGAVHGIIFEYANGKRQGSLHRYDDESVDCLTDEHIDRHCIGWTDIDHGDYIVRIYGNRIGLPMLSWLWLSVTLEFASGKRIEYASSNTRRLKGRPFSIVVPQPCLIYRIALKNGESEIFFGLVTSLHLPLSRANFAHLPPRYRRVVDELLSIAQDLDEALASSGRRTLGEDVWWSILGFVRGWDLEVPPLVTRAAPMFRSRTPLRLSHAGDS